MRLIDRRDAALAVGLIVGALIMFQRPLRFVFDLAQEVEIRYHLDLIPALAVLTVLFVFHQYRKRQEARAEAAMAAAEARQARERSEELEQIVTFGRALANALDRSALQKVLWQHLPRFVPEQPLVVLVRNHDQWDALVEDVLRPGASSVDAWEPIAVRALADPAAGTDVEGIRVDDADCFPMHVGGEPVGIIGLRGPVRPGPRERRTLGAAAALIAIAARNVQLFGEIRRNSLHDGLTGCVNRTHALATVAAELSRARRSGRYPSIVMFDIDHFKTINDQHGHLCGDRLLADVGRLLRDLLRTSDLPCRYGGDEFLIMLPDTPTLGAERVAAMLLQELAKLCVSSEHGHLTVTASIGVTHGAAGDDATTLIERADAALYQAKRRGRNRFFVSAAPHQPSQTAHVVPIYPRQAQA